MVRKINEENVGLIKGLLLSGNKMTVKQLIASSGLSIVVVRNVLRALDGRGEITWIKDKSHTVILKSN